MVLMLGSEGRDKKSLSCVRDRRAPPKILPSEKRFCPYHVSHRTFCTRSCVLQTHIIVSTVAYQVVYRYSKPTSLLSLLSLLSYFVVFVVFVVFCRILSYFVAFVVFCRILSPFVAFVVFCRLLSPSVAFCRHWSQLRLSHVCRVRPCHIINFIYGSHFVK